MPPAGHRPRLGRAVEPSALQPWLEDRRRLGVMVTRLEHQAGSQILRSRWTTPRSAPADGQPRAPAPAYGAGPTETRKHRCRPARRCWSSRYVRRCSTRRRSPIKSPGYGWLKKLACIASEAQSSPRAPLISHRQAQSDVAICRSRSTVTKPTALHSSPGPRTGPIVSTAKNAQAPPTNPHIYRASGRYLIRCGSVASAPKRRRLSSS